MDQKLESAKERFHANHPTLLFCRGGIWFKKICVLQLPLPRCVSRTILKTLLELSRELRVEVFSGTEEDGLFIEASMAMSRLRVREEKWSVVVRSGI